MYKLIDGALQAAPKYLTADDGSLIVNPTEEMLQAAGYYPLLIDAEPDYDEATQYLEAYYTQEATAIRQSWRIFQLPPEPEAEPTIADMEAALLEGVNSIV